MAVTPFFPKDFAMPWTLDGSDFRRGTPTVNDGVEDHDAGMSSVAHHGMVRTGLRPAAMAVLLGCGASACWAQTTAASPAPQPLSRECMAHAMTLLDQAKALHDGSHKGLMPKIAGDELAKVLKEGEPRGRLPTMSFITPASVYTLMVVPGADMPASLQDCPLHRTYIRFFQGGFHPQGPMYYGPIRPAEL